MKKTLFLVLLSVLSQQAMANTAGMLKNPAKGVLCDNYFCADSAGISPSLTLKYLGEKRATALSAQGEFDKSAYTFSNGVFCDTKEKQCHVDRYFDNQGKRSAVAAKETRILFNTDGRQ